MKFFAICLLLQMHSLSAWAMPSDDDELDDANYLIEETFLGKLGYTLDKNAFLFTAKSVAERQDQERNTTALFDFGYGLTDQLELDIEFPFAWNEESKGAQQDTNFIATYNFYKSRSGFWLSAEAEFQKDTWTPAFVIYKPLGFMAVNWSLGVPIDHDPIGWESTLTTVFRVGWLRPLFEVKGEFPKSEPGNVVVAPGLMGEFALGKLKGELGVSIYKPWAEQGSNYSTVVKLTVASD